MLANFAVISPALLETHNVFINISTLAFAFSPLVVHKNASFLEFGQFESTFQITNFISLISFLLYSFF